MFFGPVSAGERQRHRATHLVTLHEVDAHALGGVERAGGA
jgi:hypothetical protein